MNETNKTTEDAMQSKLEQLPSKYELVITKAEETGVRLYGLKDSETMITTYFTEFNDKVDVHSLLPWAGASTSRTQEDYDAIFKHIHDAQKAGKYTAGGKLANVFINYGHASVADMSPTFIYANGLPMHEAFWIFNHTSVGAGQELSTRYVELNDLGIMPLQFFASDLDISDKFQQRWQSIQDLMVEMYHKWDSILQPDLEQYLLADSRVVAADDEQRTAESLVLSRKTVKSRTLDAVRMWIPVGARTSLALQTSTRNWIDIIAQMRSGGTSNEMMIFSDQLTTLLKLHDYEDTSGIKAELSQLTKYNEGTETLVNNINQLGDFLDSVDSYKELLDENPLIFRPDQQPTRVELFKQNDFNSYGEALAMDYISLLHPDIEEREILKFLRTLSDGDKYEVGRIIFTGHNHHDQMHNAGDVRGVFSTIETSLAYLRDLNRHRAFGRLVPLLDSGDFEAVLSSGYNRNYVIANSEYWRHHEPAWNNDMQALYSQIYDLHFSLKEKYGTEYDPSILINILPLGHQAKMHMSAPVTQHNYMTHLRIGRGGDFGYRHVVYELLEQLRADPFLRAMGETIEIPDPNSVEQILGRS